MSFEEMRAFENLPQMRLQEPDVTNADQTLEKEWLVTNGIGGYASASLSGANTRRYHGLLVAALQPPHNRLLLLSKLEEEIRLPGYNFAFDVNEWHDANTSSHGLDYAASFTLNGQNPTFNYNFGQSNLFKTVWMEYGLNVTYVKYSYVARPGSVPAELRIRPLLNYRDYHGATRGAVGLKYNIEYEKGNTWRVEPPYPDAISWHFMVFGRPVQYLPNQMSGWYWGLHYRQEEKRGLPGANEDVYCPGTWVLNLEPMQSVTFVATTTAPEIVRELYRNNPEGRNENRQRNLLKQNPVGWFSTPENMEIDSLATRLVLAADQFIVGRPAPDKPGELLPDYRTIIAGYHWFTDWGRDTMIALPGLTLATGRYAEAATILRSFARYTSKGMLPNRFPDNMDSPTLDEGYYNTVDGTLWYFDAVDKYLTATDDWTLAQDLYPTLTEIMNCHVAGTRFGIKLDNDGLLLSGAPGVQLTWMDVKIQGWVVTPRYGKAVEICALWYKACRVMERLAAKIGTPVEVQQYRELAEKVVANFEPSFWHEEGGYLLDCLSPAGQPDTTLRPNQVIAIAVAPELVSEAKRREILTKARAHLLTPYGLRTLDPKHPNYRPRFGGDAVQRDSAYHQGTVWAWLLGPFARALLNLRDSAEVRDELRQLLRPFLKHIDEAGVGQISEVFSAEFPHEPGGTVAQAWSVAQLLEIWQMVRK
jgi:predicted glycogen debranching enzyme